MNHRSRRISNPSNKNNKNNNINSTNNTNTTKENSPDHQGPINDNHHTTNDKGKASHYEIGYRKPPKEHQFKKGYSGNLKGRPKRKIAKPIQHYNEPFKDAFIKEAYRKVEVNDGGKTRRVTMIEAAARSIMVNAINGNTQCQKMAFQFISSIEKQDRSEKEEIFKNVADYKQEWSIHKEELREKGHPIPAMYPDPDHIQLDFDTAEFIIKGPLTDEQIAKWKIMEERRKEAHENIQEAKIKLKNSTCPKMKVIHQDMIISEMAILLILNKYLGHET